MEYLPLGCFGKAPCDRGYLEYNTSQKSSRTMRTWIREGFKEARLKTEGEGKNDFREGDGRRFLLELPDAGELLAGVIGPSTDMQPRENVLALFTHIPRRSYSKHPHLLPLALEPVWSALEDSRNHLLEIVTKDAFEDYLLGTKVPAPAPPGEVKAEYLRMQSDSVHRIFQRGDGVSLSTLRKNVPGVAGQIRKAGTGSTLAVEFPVSEDLPIASFEISFWVDLLNHQFLWKSFQPSIFLERSAGTGRHVVLLYGGGLPTSVYEPLMGPADRYGDLLAPCLETNLSPTEVENRAVFENGEEELSFGKMLAEKFPR
jgi:hypothetical protein